MCQPYIESATHSPIETLLLVNMSVEVTGLGKKKLKNPNLLIVFPDYPP